MLYEVITMDNRILTRMGDGERVWLSSSDVRADIDEGTADAAKRTDIPELTDEERKQLFDIIADPSRVVSVQPGEEVIVTDDGCSMSFYSGQDGGGVGIPMSRMQAVLVITSYSIHYTKLYEQHPGKPFPGTVAARCAGRNPAYCERYSYNFV